MPAGKVKVVTGNGVVYLMGKITRSDSELVVAEVQKSFGVQKIVWYSTTYPIRGRKPQRGPLQTVKV